MSDHKPQITVLCEDPEHWHFVRHVLLSSGWDDHKIKQSMAPAGKGSAEQWVREQYPKELAGYRRMAHKRKVALLVMTDADNKSVQSRKNLLATLRNNNGLPPRRRNEKVAFAIPKRNIEGWFHFLTEGIVDETDPRDRHKSKYKECKVSQLAARLKDICRQEEKNRPRLPSSLADACTECRRIGLT